MPAVSLHSLWWQGTGWRRTVRRGAGRSFQVQYASSLGEMDSHKYGGPLYLPSELRHEELRPVLPALRLGILT